MPNTAQRSRRLGLRSLSSEAGNPYAMVETITSSLGLCSRLGTEAPNFHTAVFLCSPTYAIVVMITNGIILSFLWILQ